LSLEQVKRWIVPLFEELGQEFMDNHAGLKLRKTGSSGKTVPTPADEKRSRWRYSVRPPILRTADAMLTFAFAHA
jgi:hypothetical protein